jgi:F-type H+-transporting ATPase subunit b
MGGLVHGLIATAGLILAQAEEEVSEAKDLYPKLSELIIAALAFGILFFFMWKWVFPRVNKLLEERREGIQGNLEKAEQAKTEAEQLLGDYRQQLAGARDEANRIIEEGRRTAEGMRKDMTARAEQEYQGIVARAQDEIRTERDRVFQELKAQIGQLSLDLAARTVGQQLDKDRHLQLVDEYIEELSKVAPSNGHGAGPEG